MVIINRSKTWEKAILDIWNSRAQLLLSQLTLTSKHFSRVIGVISLWTDCAVRMLVFSPAGLHRWCLWPTNVGKYHTCTLSCQPEDSTALWFRGNHSSVYFSALYKLFQSLQIYRELQRSAGAEQLPLSLDDVTWALCQSFRGLKKCMHGVSDM